MPSSTPPASFPTTVSFSDNLCSLTKGWYKVVVKGGGGGGYINGKDGGDSSFAIPEVGIQLIAYGGSSGGGNIGGNNVNNIIGGGGAGGSAGSGQSGDGHAGGSITSIFFIWYPCTGRRTVGAGGLHGTGMATNGGDGSVELYKT
jgi:hypothetical protein